MNLPDDELAFLRDLVKATRQRRQVVSWVDRDGTRRQTALTEAEATRLKRLAHAEGLAGAELLRRIAFIPQADARKPVDGTTRSGPVPPPAAG